MGDRVIVGFRPRQGRDAARLAVVRDHVPTLRRLEKRPPIGAREQHRVDVAHHRRAAR